MSAEITFRTATRADIPALEKLMPLSMAVLGRRVYSPDELDQSGEKFMGMAEEVPPPPPPTYDQAKFDANFPQWAEIIRAGRKTADAFIQFVEARGEPYTEEQKAKLRAVKVDTGAAATDVEAKPKAAAEAPSASPIPAAAAPVETPAAAFTYAVIADRIAKAQTQEDLQDMDELIGRIADAGQREELTTKLKARADELPPF